MKLIIFGATGSIGRHLVAQALEAGHTVTAFTRRPGKSAGEHPQLHYRAGDVLRPADVEAAVRGQDAVLCALGAGRKGGVRAEGTRNILQAMEKAGVRRFICQTTLGAGDSRANLNFFWKRVMFGLLLRAAYRDHQQQEAYIRQSALDWTIVRPAAFTDGGKTDRYRHGFGPAERNLALKISRADVAAFMLRQLQEDGYRRRAAGLSY
ncbi:MAG TPA: SDR family oxidoreductase [Chitinophagaceae bacterium]|jgi:putative NADH-flavin reductase|nr:SDR family oxidoreductase [Chitinophagaceae bacterium]